MRLINLAPTGSRCRHYRPRTGFTLIELMVAMALSLFLMAILSEAFAVSMDTFRGMRAIGDTQESLRNSLRQMRDDLASAHFEGGRKMSDNGFWMEPRREGFFYMKGSVPTNEGTDPNNMVSSRATNHVMHFAVRKQGYRPNNFFSVGPFSGAPYPPPPPSTANPPPPPSPPIRFVPANNPLDTYYSSVITPPVSVQDPTGSSQAYIRSQWAEVAYLIRPMAGSPTPTTPETTGVPGGAITLYNLYRAEVTVLPYRDSTPISNLNNVVVGNQLGISLLSHLSFNTSSGANYLSPNDIAMPSSPTSGRCFNPNVTTPSPLQVSLVCNNVVSFQIRLLVQRRNIGTNGSDPNVVKDPVQPTNVMLFDMASYIFATNPTDPAIDTAATTLPGWATPISPSGNGSQPSIPDRIVGVQIRLRIYDPASGLVRQNTLVQAL
jgi:prepilin-type N-terminal cleavage/methylation domain-containing protein